MIWPDIPAEVWAAFIAVFGTVGGTWFGGWLNRKQASEMAKTMVGLERERYARERLWDAKRISYTEIVGLSQAFLRSAASIISEREDNDIDYCEFYSSDWFIQLKNENLQSYRDLIKLCDDTRLIQSEDFAETISRLKDDVYAFDTPEAVRDFESEQDYLHERSVRFARSAERTHDALLSIALSEMKSA